MIQPLVVFRGIEKTFAEAKILRNVDISLYPGNVFCLLEIMVLEKLHYLR